jgi:hypothetical protein
MISHLQVEPERRMARGVDAPGFAVGEALRQGHVEGVGRRLGGTQQHALVHVDHLVEHRLGGIQLRRRDQRQGGAWALGAQLVEFLHRGVEGAVRDLGQLVVEVVVDLAVHVPDHAQHAQQPDAADPDDERARQPPGERIAGPELGLCLLQEAEFHSSSSSGEYDSR